MDSIADDAGGKRARGLDRAFEILDFLRQNRRALKPNEIAAQIGAPRSSVYELVNLLLRNGILEFTGGDGRVFLGRKLYFLGAAYENHFDFTRECENALEWLAGETRETAQFCMLDGNKYMVVRVKEGARPFRIATDVGRLIPIPWTASGRLLVSHLSNEEILAFIPKSDFRLPNGEWLEPQTFLAEVRQAEKDGFFTFNSIVDSFTHCFAVPLKDESKHPVATLCLVTPRDDGLANRDHYLSCLMKAAVSLRDATRTQPS
ncbi:IclR family transcriptional regulator [Rhizobium sp. Root73]|uniref:IclR family transcriptional regulator n=1 Tax=unclassified Rhizobium TaxID=2613769 RepID=UPI0007264D72|nr:MULTISPECIES: IclR family transcriptional regulator [unclassified Rhizobium]KQY00469.1 IclR family transcriptional regulator [Rhizobium sp. Root1334]KRC11654.1 IclR family transcriptional regulator [Rhizobium sp. Root73]